MTLSKYNNQQIIKFGESFMYYSCPRPAISTNYLWSCGRHDWEYQIFCYKKNNVYIILRKRKIIFHFNNSKILVCNMHMYVNLWV